MSATARPHQLGAIASTVHRHWHLTFLSGRACKHDGEPGVGDVALPKAYRDGVGP